jgi:hypothetical protein
MHLHGEDNFIKQNWESNSSHTTHHLVLVYEVYSSNGLQEALLFDKLTFINIHGFFHHKSVKHYIIT